MSDYDFAIYLDEKDDRKRFELRLSIINDISSLLKTDNIDLSIINDIESPELKYFIIQEGKLIFEREPYKIVLEPKILSNYFDFIYLLRKNNLTKA